MSASLVTFVIGENPPPRLDKALARDVPEAAALSRSRLAKLIGDGAVQVDGVVVSDPRYRVAEGAPIAITVEVAAESHIGPEDIPLTVVFEDDDLIVVNHTVERRYLALCYGEPSSNDPRLRGIKGASFEASNILRVQTFLGRHKTDRQRQAVSFTTGRHAVTRARIVESLGVPPVGGNCRQRLWEKQAWRP